MLDEGAAFRVPTTLHDLFVDPVALGDPAIKRGGAPVLGGQADGPIEGDPAHEPAVGELLPASPGLPDAFLGLVPVVGEPVHDRGECLPALPAHLQPVLVCCVDAVQGLAVDVELDLIGSAVADPYGPRTPISRPVLE